MSTISGLGGGNRPWDIAPSGTARRAEHEAQRFAQVDSDGSGSVDATELAAMLERAGASGGSTELLKKMDSNGDGGLSSDELSQGMRSLIPPPASTLDFAQSRGAANDEGADFSALDTDGDGQLSRAEFAAGRAPSGPRGAGGPPPGAGGPPPASTGDSASSTSATASADDPLDLNHDGTVSQIERLAGQLKELAQSGATDSASGVSPDIAALAQKLYDQISRHWLQPATDASGSLSTTA